jgi:hypothetical protein
MNKERKIKNDMKIELRSEKVRNIIGEVPPKLVRISISIIILILVVMIVAMFTIHYPSSGGKTIARLIFGL